MKLHFLIASFCFFLGGLFAQTKNPGNTVSELFPVITNQGGFDTGLTITSTNNVKMSSPTIHTEGFVASVEEAYGKTLLVTCTDLTKQRCWTIPVSKEFRPQKGWNVNRWYVFHSRQFPIGLEPRQRGLDNKDRILPAADWIIRNTPMVDGAHFEFISEPLGDEWKKRGYMEYRPKRATSK